MEKKGPGVVFSLHYLHALYLKLIFYRFSLVFSQFIHWYFYRMHVGRSVGLSLQFEETSSTSNLTKQNSQCSQLIIIYELLLEESALHHIIIAYPMLLTVNSIFSFRSFGYITSSMLLHSFQQWFQGKLIITSTNSNNSCPYVVADTTMNCSLE